jgi:GABA(A) receptor-associated protein
MNDFKRKFTFEKRKNESIRILLKYPDRIPIIVENKKNSSLPIIDKHKFLTPSELTFGQFIYVIRKRLVLKPEKALFLFVNNTLIPGSKLLKSVYNEHKDEDGFLYVTICSENTFG